MDHLHRHLGHHGRKRGHDVTGRSGRGRAGERAPTLDAREDPEGLDDVRHADRHAPGALVDGDGGGADDVVLDPAQAVARDLECTQLLPPDDLGRAVALHDDDIELVADGVDETQRTR